MALTPAEFATRMVAVGNAVKANNKHSVEEGLKFGKKTMLASLAAAGAPSQRLRGVGKRGARLGVQYKVGGSDSDPIGLMHALGPWQFIENNTRPHDIPRSRSKRAKRRYAVINGQPYSIAHHPGTSGKHPWHKGVAIANVEMPKIYAKAQADIIRKVF